MNPFLNLEDLNSIQELARQAFSEGEYRRAVDLWTRAISLDPSNFIHRRYYLHKEHDLILVAIALEVMPNFQIIKLPLKMPTQHLN